MDQNGLSTSDSEESGEEAHLRGGRASGIRALLQEEIESGKLTPGTQLDERALATRFQVSRTPVREALQQLAVADLVRITPRHGASVTRLTVSQMRAIMETVGELESVAAKLSARRVDDDLRRQLDQAMDRCQEAAIQGGPAEYTLANHLFHDTIYAGSRNPYIAELIRKARSHMHRYRLKDFHSKGQISKSLQDHLRIVRAIQEGDEGQAAYHMMQHVPAGASGFSEFLARMPMSFFESETQNN